MLEMPEGREFLTIPEIVDVLHMSKPREFARMDAQLQAQRDRDGDMRGIGDWHTHPAGGGTRPSSADLQAYAAELATIADHNSSLTSLIVSPYERSGSWAQSAVSAWITRHARSSFGERMVCEPAIVSIR